MHWLRGFARSYQSDDTAAVGCELLECSAFVAQSVGQAIVSSPNRSGGKGFAAHRGPHAFEYV